MKITTRSLRHKNYSIDGRKIRVWEDGFVDISYKGKPVRWLNHHSPISGWAFKDRWPVK